MLALNTLVMSYQSLHVNPVVDLRCLITSSSLCSLAENRYSGISLQYLQFIHLLFDLVIWFVNAQIKGMTRTVYRYEDILVYCLYRRVKAVRDIHKCTSGLLIY